MDVILTERSLTGAKVSFSVYAFPDGSVVVSKHGVPVPGAEWLYSADIPALDTSDGFASVGDWWVRPKPEGGGDEIVVCLSEIPDFAYYRLIADEPSGGFSNARKTEWVQDSSLLRLSATPSILNGLRRGTISRSNPAAVISNGRVTTDAARVAVRRTVKDVVVRNHKSVSFDAQSGATNSYGTTLSWNHTAGSGSDACAVIHGGARQADVSSITYGGNSTTHIGGDQGQDQHLESYRYLAPGSGSSSVLITASTDALITGCCQTFFGVDQTTPVSASSFTNVWSGSSINDSVSSASGEMVSGASYWAKNGVSLTPDSSWANNTEYGQDWSAMLAGYEDGTTTVSRTDTSSGAVAGIVMALVALKASAGGGYTLVASPGSFTLTGNAVNFDYQPLKVVFIGSATGTNTTTLPTHKAGDLILLFAYRDGSTTAPTVPSGRNWTTEMTGSGANTNSSVVVAKIATSGSETTGTFTNATSVVAHVYRGTKQTVADAIGATASGGASSTTVNYPALSMQVTDGTSWVVGFAGHRQTNTSLETPPSGMVNRANVQDATDEASGHDTNGGVSSWSSTNVSVGGTSSGWRSRVLEIIAAPVVQTDGLFFGALA